MTSSSEAELLIAVLRYVAVCVDSENREELIGLGLSEVEIDSVPSLSLEDLQVLTRSPSIAKNILELRFKPDGLSRMINHAIHEREYRKAKFELIRSGAPQPMMFSLYKMGFNEYAYWRKHFKLTGGYGRPSYRVQDERNVWYAFKDLGKARVELTPMDYLALHHKTQTSLRTIWRLFEEWESEGLLPSKAMNGS